MTEAERTYSRRELLSWLIMGGALALSYGFFSILAGRFIYPRKKGPSFREIFVATRGEIVPGRPLAWTAPDGQKVIVNNVNGELLALSNVCPHLGCKVHWEAVNDRFFCPCHHGAFDKNGIATAGPPKAEGKNLKRYDLKIEGEAVYLKWEEA